MAGSALPATSQEELWKAYLEAGGGGGSAAAPSPAPPPGSRPQPPACRAALCGGEKRYLMGSAGDSAVRDGAMRGRLRGTVRLQLLEKGGRQRSELRAEPCVRL